MKVVIIGGAGIRVPLLTNGLLRFHSDLPVEELVLWDIDEARRRTIARISRAMVARFDLGLKVSTPSRLETALADASYVISSIRVGGIRGRILDETIALTHQTLGQETVGAGGFALALRSLPVMLEYARKIVQQAPQAWLLNFTNPVGILSQAMIETGFGDRSIGICDTPREQFESLAHALNVSLDQAFFDYLGLNHLGWVRSIVVDGRDRMPELLASPVKLARIYRLPFFEIELLQKLGVLPTEYLYYYYSPEEARRKTSTSGNTRGQLVSRLEAELIQQVEADPETPGRILEAYEQYLARRNATYMALESGEEIGQEDIARARAKLYKSAVGYERIAIDVMRAIHNNRPTVMPVDVANQGAIAEFAPMDAVEVPCVVDTNGPHPLAAGRLPESVKSLALRVKEYERLTVRAALEGSKSIAEDALVTNPIIQTREQARAILQDYLVAHKPHLDYLN